MASIRETLAVASHRRAAGDGRALDGRADVLDDRGRRRRPDAARQPARARADLLPAASARAACDQLRVDHLPAIRVPTLFVSGTNDAFGTPDELTHWTATMSPKAKVVHVWLEGKGHDLKGCDDRIADDVTDVRGSGWHAPTGTASSGLSTSSSRWAVSGKDASTTATTTTWASGDHADHAAVVDAGVEQGADEQDPDHTAEQRGVVSSPAARPRLPVGNNSGAVDRQRRIGDARRRTRRRTPHTHIGAPPTTNDNDDAARCASGIATAIRWRRPRMSASRPPTTRPSAAGVAVVSVNNAILRRVEPARPRGGSGSGRSSPVRRRSSGSAATVASAVKRRRSSGGLMACGRW